MNIQIGTTQKLDFVLVDSAGVEVPGLGAVFTVLISKNGGALGASAGAKAEIGDGWYSYTLTATETDTAGPLALAITGVGTVQQNLLYQVTGYNLSAITTGDDYCTLAELKARLTITDSDDDGILSAVIEAVSRQIDKETKRRFYTTASNEIRYYTPRSGNMLFPNDDILSIDTFECDDDGDGTYDETWQNTDYYLQPYNAALDGRPYLWIETTPIGDYSFTLMKKSVKLTGKFGYCAIADLPYPIREACLLQCERIFKRKDAPFGVAGTPELGMLRLQAELDPDVQKLIAPYKRPVL